MNIKSRYIDKFNANRYQMMTPRYLHINIMDESFTVMCFTRIKILKYPRIKHLNSWNIHPLRTQIELEFQLYNPLQACNLFLLLSKWNE